MKTFTLTFFILFQALFSSAQRDPSKEILVFFKEGVAQSEKLLNGKLEKTASLTKDNLKAALQKAGIEEAMLEIAMPRFKKADTLRTLTDGTTIQQLDMTKLFRIKVPEGKSRKELIEKLRALPEVLYAEENGTISPLLIPSDVQYTDQWSLNNPVNPGADIHAEAAWDIFTGNPDNIIAVIDGGTDINHPDLNDKIAGADTGFGWGGHGIHVSGIAAAESNNSQGVSGVDWQARILAKRIDNLSDDADTYQAIVDAVNFSPNVRVLNHSWGIANPDQSPGRYSTTIAQAFAIAYKANRVSVAAMGNHQLTNPGIVNYPAGFNNVIAVGATDAADVIANFSVQGNNIDVSAPGVNILSTLTNNGYIVESGTSMAAPHVSGIASLLKGFNIALANDDIEHIIEISADDVNFNAFPGYDQQIGNGRVNAAQALGLLQAPNSINHFTASGGTVAGSTSNYTAVFYATPGLAPGTYIVKRYEVTKAITFPFAFCNIVGAWGRGVGTTGYNEANPNYGEGFCEVVPGTLTNTGATLRTYVYEVYNILGQSMGYYPTTPGNVTFAYTVLGIRPPEITGPASVCTSETYSIPSLPPGATVIWSATGSITVPPGSTGNSVTVTSNGTGSGVLTASVTSPCGNSTVSKTITSGTPVITALNYSYIYDGVEQSNPIQRYYSVANNVVCVLGTNFNAEFSIEGATSIIPEVIYQSDPGAGWGQGGGSGTISLYSYFTGYGQEIIFRITATSACGSDVFEVGFRSEDCYGQYQYTIFPNPASNEINVEAKYENGEKKQPGDNFSEKPKPFNVKLYNDKGTILKETENKGQLNVTINTQNLLNGNYFLHITEGKKVIKKQVIIQH